MKHTIGENIYRYCGDKFDEHMEGDHPADKVKGILWGLAAGVPDGLIAVGAMYSLAMMYLIISGKRWTVVDK